MRVAVRRAGVLLDAGSGTLVNAASRVDLDAGRLWNCEFFRNFPYSECFPFPGISPIPSMLHGPVTVSAPGARIRIGRVRRKHMIYSVCRFSTDPFAKRKCVDSTDPFAKRKSFSKSKIMSVTLTLSPHRIDNRPHVIWSTRTLHAPINSKTLLSLRRRGCCACGVRALPPLA